MYIYIGNGASFERIPARDLTDAEWNQHTAGLDKKARAVAAPLYDHRTDEATPETPTPTDGE